MSGNFEGGKVRTTRGDVQLRYEDAAAPEQMSGWKCLGCGMFWHGPQAEHQARFCCHTDAPCECGGRKDRHNIHCKNCWDRISAEKYAKLEQVDVLQPPYKGDPLVSGDTYFFDDDAILEHCLEHDVKPSSLQLLLCRPHNPHPIFLAELFIDYLGEECDLPGDSAEVQAIEKAIDSYVEKNKPWSWYPDYKRRPTDANLAAYDAEFEKDKAEPTPLDDTEHDDNLPETRGSVPA